MPVYVDDWFQQARVGRLNSRWCHLVADTPDELHEFAQRLGLRREWAQSEDDPVHLHYDVTSPKRDQAIRLGAIPITWRQMGQRIIAARKEQEMPGKKATDGSGSKWTRMHVDTDMSNMNIRREHLAHIVHYKTAVHWMKKIAKEAGRPIHMLNVGCGEANELRLFWTADQSRKTDVLASYTGIDGDPGVIERTQEKAATCLRGINGKLKVVDITKGKFPVKPGSQDFVLSNEVLEHIPKKGVRPCLRAIHRALADDGVAMISTPNKDGTSEKLPADHVYEWRYAELHEEMEKAGLVCIEEMGVYIKKSNLVRAIKENYEPEMVDEVNDIWDRYGNDLGSMMTADLAPEVANNVIHICVKKGSARHKAGEF